jgi:WD40 repeat protein
MSVPNLKNSVSFVAGRYQLGDEIARGGMGAVFRVRDANLDRDLAVKVMLADPKDRPDLASRFVAEAKLTAGLQHPGVVPVHEVGTLPDGRPFFAMKLVRGRTLAERLEARVNVSDDLPGFLDVFLQVCRTMGFAHANGVIHRDLKPLNVMVGDFGEVQVMDWGLARFGDQHQPAASDKDVASIKPANDPGTGEGQTLPLAEGVAKQDMATLPLPTPSASDQETRVGSIMGTPAYMSPEQARGEPVDTRSDVFALGAMLCEILTGDLPWGLGTPELVRFRAAQAMLEPARESLERCGADLELVTLCMRCLSSAAADRPADGKAVAEAVAAYRAGVEERARKAEAERAAAEAEAREQRKRRRVQLYLAGAVGTVVLLAAGGVMLGALLRQSQKNEEELGGLNRDLQAERDKLDTANAQLGVQKDLAEASERKAASSDYARTVHFAHRALHERGPTHARRFLDDCPKGLRGWEWDLVARQCPTPVAEVGVRGSEGLKEIAVSEDGRRALVTDRLTLWLYELPTLRLIRTIPTAEDGKVFHLKAASDGNEFRVGYWNGTFVRFSAENGQQLGKFKIVLPEGREDFGALFQNLSTGPMGNTQLSDDGSRLFVKEKGLIRVVNLNGGREVCQIKLPGAERSSPESVIGPAVKQGDPQFANQVELDRTGSLLVVALPDGRVPVYRVEASPVCILDDLRRAVGVQRWRERFWIRPDGTAIAIECGEPTFRFGTPASSEIAVVSLIPGSVTQNVTVMKEVERMGRKTTVTEEVPVNITTLPYTYFRWQTVPKLDLKFTPDSHRVVSFDSEGVLRVHTLPARPRFSPALGPGFFSQFQIGGSDDRIDPSLAGPHEGNLADSASLTVSTGMDLAMVLHISDRYAVLANGRDPERFTTVAVVDLQTGGMSLLQVEIEDASLHFEDIKSPVMVSDRGRSIVLGFTSALEKEHLNGGDDRDSRTDLLRVFNLRSPTSSFVSMEIADQPVAPGSIRSKQVARQAIARDAGILFQLDVDDDLATYDVRTGQILRMSRPHAAEVECIATDPMGNVVATGTSHGTVRVKNHRTGEQSSFEEPGWPVALVAVSSDASRVAVAFAEPTALETMMARAARTYQVAGELLKVPVPTERPPNYESLIKVWDLRSGKVVASWKTKDEPQVLAFAEDSNDLHIGFDNGSILSVDSEGRRREVAKLKARVTVLWATRDRVVAVTERDLVPNLIELRSGRVTRLIGSHGQVIKGVSGSLTANRLVTWTTDEVKVWALDSGYEVLEFGPKTGISDDVGLCQILDDGSLVVLTTGHKRPGPTIGVLFQGGPKPPRANRWRAPPPRTLKPDVAPSPRGSSGAQLPVFPPPDTPVPR